MDSFGRGLGPVKGVIRHRETEKYYKGNGEWVTESHQAKQFEHLSEVVEEAKRFGLEGSCEFVVEVNGQIGFRVMLPL